MITALQRETRRQFLGASDVAAVLGLDPYRTPADVYLSKTADMVQDDDSEAAALGNHFERPILQWAEKQIGTLDYDVPTVKAANGVMGGHLDASVLKTGAPVEAKMSGISDEWGEPGTDQVPAKFLVQVHAQMICAGAEVAYIAALLTGVRSIKDACRIYVVPCDGDLAKRIEEDCVEWWNAHVVARVMPESAPSLEMAKRIRWTPGSISPVPAELAAAKAASAAKLKEATKEDDDNKARILAALNGAEAGECPGWDITNKEIVRKAYTVEAGSYHRLTVNQAK